MSNLLKEGTTLFCTSCETIIRENCVPGEQTDCAHVCDKCWYHIETLINKDKQEKFGSNPFGA